MALIVIEHEHDPYVADVVGLYELENELGQMIENNQINIISDFLQNLKTVKTFMCHEDRVQIVRAEDLQWNDFVSDLYANLQNLLASLEVHMEQDNIKESDIEAIIDEMIRPALAQHAGNIAITYLKEGVLGLKLLGTCQGCPFSLLTLTSHVSRIMSMYFPSIIILHIQQGIFQLQ